jgi:excisionase family DNA binding protein
MGVSRSAAYNEIKLGRIGYIRLSGGSIRIPRSCIEQWISEHTVRSKRAS